MPSQHPKGSEWRKWDLHVHTPASFEHGFGDWDDYITALGEVHDIAVLGITDYFTIEGYKKVLRLRDDGSLHNFSLVIPNIELRLNIFVPKRSSGEQQRRLNIHVLFSNEVKVEDIESQFLHALKITIEGSPGGTADERVLTRESIEEVGKSVKAFQASTAIDSDFVAGCKNITVSLPDITKALQKSCFDGKYLLILPTPDWDQISWEGQDYLTRKTLLQTAHAVFCGQESTINWCLGKGDLDSDQFKKEFGCLKPSLHGSDAHTIKHLCKPENGKFCWIKSDLTFEGLKQIVYEPELRVRVQEENPSESETYAKISSFAISLPNDLKIKDESGEKTDFCLNGKYSLELSNNLTCVIGGRGSGKSTLAHIIYNSWINHDPKKLNSINSPLLNLEMRPSPLINVSKSTDCEVPSQTEFFFQNEIENAAKNISSMSSLIRNRLLKLSSIDGGETLFDLQGAWKTSSDSVNELVDAYDRISLIENEVSRAKENINTLKKQTEIIKSSEYKAFQTKIGELTSKIASFKSYKTDFEKLIKQIESLSVDIAQLNWTDDQGKKTLSILKEALESHKGHLKETFTRYNSDYVTKDFPTQLKNEEQDLSAYLKDRGLSPENVQELTQANSKIKEYEEQIRLAQIDKKPFDQFYSERTKTVEAYKTSYEAYKARFRSVILSLQERLAGLSMSEKEITFSLEIDFSHVKNGLVEFVKENLEDDISLRSDAIERLLFDNTAMSILVRDKISIRDNLSQSTKAEKHRLIIQELINNEIFLERFHLRLLKYFYDINNINVQTKMGGKLLKNTSFGERCGIVISIVLVAGTNPIVIDQPEDHLDGRFISDVLVPLLRLQKQNRQIILITRDANIAVGGDTELMHILESTDERTEIIASSIENIDRREKYIWILDGGADAFAGREQKYNIELLKLHSKNSS